jgi:hypothetical protein
MLGIERALAAVVGSGRYRRPRVSGSLAVLHAYSFAQQLEMIGQTHVWVSGIGTNLMPALFLPAGAVVLVYSQPAPMLWKVTEQLCQSVRLAYGAIKALLRLPVKALLRPHAVGVDRAAVAEALFRLYYGSIKALLRLY